MHDQAAQLRKLVRASVHADATLAPGGPVITLTGAQPEIGVTTIACGLARELVRLGKQVVLVDANLAAPNIASHFDHPHPSPPRGTLADVLAGTRRAVEVLTPANEDGLRLLPGCSAIATPPLDQEAVDRFTTELAALGRQADAVLIDAGHGMNAWADCLWQLSMQALIVSSPTSQGLIDAYAAAKLSQYDRHDGKLRLLVNGANEESEARRLGDSFAETCQRFLNIRPKIAASLPAIDLRVCDSTSQHRQQQRETFQRALRLLAADLTAEIRVASLRLIRPNFQTRHCEMRAPGSAGGRL